MEFTNKKPFIAGNWKMHMTIAEARSLVREVKAAAASLPDAVMTVIPPYTALSNTAEVVKESPIRLGAQNIFWEEKGAFTGEISPAMLKDAGCTCVVIGHSERRQYFGETDETVNKKIRAALRHGLMPILCIGESLEEREKGLTLDKIHTQLEEGLKGFSPEEFSEIVIAYEPLWAIGTGLTATPEQAQDVHAFIREECAQKYGNEASGCAIILYGGSVKPANTFSLMQENDINGALVGGAALKAESFIEITKEAVRAFKKKWQL